MPIWCKHSTQAVTTGDRNRAGDINHLRLDTGRNMTVSGQVCIRDIEDLHIGSIDLSGVPAGVTAEHHFRDNIYFNDGIPYPDILTHRDAMTVKAHVAQVLLVTFRVDADATPGTYRIELVMKTQHGTCGAIFTLVIHEAVLPDPKDSAFFHEYMFNYDGHFSFGDYTPKATPFPDCPRYSEGWWSLMAAYAREMKALRCNVLNLNPLALLGDSGSRRISPTEWTFDYTLLDRFIDICLTHGSFRMIAMSSIINSVEGKFIHAIDEKGRNCRIDIFTPEANAWFEAVFGGIYRHFEAKGWLSMLAMRLEDEPHTTEYWKWARALCRRLLPGIPCGEPLDMHASSMDLVGECDQYIPRLDVYAEDPAFYRRRQAAGDQVWCYSCCYPEEPEWLNKFMDRPVIHSRLMYWACYAQGITGFLHWGLNHWTVEGYGMIPEARFKGDGFIIYPDTEHTDVKPSIRGVASREGLQDVELLYLLEKKYPFMAKAIAARIARSFTDYTLDEGEVDRCRAEMLTILDR